MAQQIAPDVRTARLIYASMIAGVAVMWAIILTLFAGSASSEAALDTTVALAILIAIALGSFATALVFRSKAVAAVSDAPAHMGEPSERNLADLQTNLIVAWALLEAPALIAAVLFMLTGAPSLLIVGAVVFIVGYAMTFPRAEWYGVEHTSSEMRS